MTEQARLHVGTDERQVLQGRGMRGGGYGPRASARQPVAAGMHHAVPEGQRRALCDITPLHDWPHLQWPGGSFTHPDDICEVCAERADKSGPPAP